MKAAVWEKLIVMVVRGVARSGRSRQHHTSQQGAKECRCPADSVRQASNRASLAQFAGLLGAGWTKSRIGETDGKGEGEPLSPTAST